METRLVAFSRRLGSLGVLLLASSGSATAAVPAARNANTAAAGHAAAHAHAHLGLFASDLNECATQANSCLGDVECVECMTSYVDHPIEFDDCMGDYDPDWPSATACDVKAAQPCCFDLVSGGNCLESDYFLEYWGCWFEEFAACPDYELTCTGNAETSSGISESSSGSTSAAAAEAVEAAAGEGSGAAGIGVAPGRTLAVAAASSLAVAVAAGALLAL